MSPSKLKFLRIWPYCKPQLQIWTTPSDSFNQLGQTLSTPSQPKSQLLRTHPINLTFQPGTFQPHQKDNDPKNWELSIQIRTTFSHFWDVFVKWLIYEIFTRYNWILIYNFEERSNDDLNSNCFTRTKSFCTIQSTKLMHKPTLWLIDFNRPIYWRFRNFMRLRTHEPTQLLKRILRISYTTLLF